MEGVNSDMMKERMNVYITTSRKHLAYAYVSIYSLFENNTESEIYLYIVSEDIEEADLVNEYQIADQFGHHIIIIPFDDEMARSFTNSSDEQHWPMATMSCYWMFHTLLPDDVDRIMAIESDTVTIGSLYDVYHVDMGDAYMACPGPEHKPKSHMEFVESLGGQCVTFVLSVYDVKRIKKDFALEDIFQADSLVRRAAGRSQMEFTFGILFKDHIQYIPGKESCLDENREYVRILGWDYITETEKTCKLLHFSSYEDYAKPWNPVELMPGYYYWWKYAKKSPYFREYMERQWEIYSKTVKDKEELKKNITYKNVLAVAFIVFTALMAIGMAVTSHSIIYGTIALGTAITSLLIAVAIREVLKKADNLRRKK